LLPSCWSKPAVVVVAVVVKLVDGCVDVEVIMLVGDDGGDGGAAVMVK
jgi:hypothetical protein